MIGSSEISTHGVTQSGQVVPIIVDGDWRLS